MGVNDDDIWAVRAYREWIDDHGLPKYISNWRDNVTDQAVEMAYRHMQRCKIPTCYCKKYVISRVGEIQEDP